MSGDPFARFEQSRGGLLIPVAIFVAGAIATLVSMSLVDRLDFVESRRAAEAMQVLGENGAIDRQHVPPDAPLLPSEPLSPNQAEQETK